MQKHQGLSLIELLIAITLGLVLIGGVVQMFVSTRVVFSTQQSLSRVQEGGRFAINFVGTDIRMAGYLGCTSPEAEVESDVDDGFWTQFIVRQRSAVHAIEGFTAENLPNDALLDPAPIANSDVLVVRYAGGAPHILSEDATQGEIKLKAAGVIPTANCANGICNEANLMVSNCAGAHIFQAQNVSWAADVTTITHPGPWPDLNLPVSHLTAFDRGSELLPVYTVVLYVALNPAGRPALYRRETGGQSVELIDGVEDLRFRYSSDGDYLTAAEVDGVDQWLRVDSVLVEFLLQGNEDNVLEAPQSYSFGGEEVAGPADRRVRQVFSTVVGIRSRME